MSVCRELTKQFGGRWAYDRRTWLWHCNDGRHAHRVHTGGYDINGEPMPGSAVMVYERDGQYVGRLYDVRRMMG